MANTKKYLITALTLGAIAAGSAALIGVTNLVTRDAIKNNEIKRINKGIAAIFGENASISNEYAIEGYQYANYVYEVENTEDPSYALRTTGSNMYGKISLLVGLKQNGSDFVFVEMYVVSNEQTYASTLVDNYIDPLNGGEVELDDVSCGATYGAKLVRDMINDAKQAAGEKLGK